MASPEWMEIYRSYSPADLAAAIVTLRSQATLYSQQAMGNKSYSKDLAEVKNRLHAATRVTNERANANPNNPKSQMQARPPPRRTALTLPRKPGSSTSGA